MSVKRVPSILIVHPRVRARMEAMDAEMRRLLTPETLADFDREAKCFVLGGGDILEES